MSKWPMVRLGDFITQVRGVSYKPEHASDIAKERYVGLLRANNIENGKINPDGLIYVDSKVVSEKQFVNKDDILLASSSGSISVVGKTAIANNDTTMVFGAFCKVIRTNGKILPRYLSHYFRSTKYRRIIEQVAGGANINNLRNEHIDELIIPLPPLDEQKRIAAILDKTQSLIDLRKQQLTEMDSLAQSAFIEMFGDPVTNLKGWCMESVDQMVNKGIIDRPIDGNHGEKHPKVKDYVPSGVPFIMANNLEDGRVDYSSCNFITKTQANSLDKGFSHNGDVLLTHKGTIGRTAIVDGNYDLIILTPQVTYYRPLKCVCAEYLKAYFDTTYFQTEMMKIAGIGSTRAYIGITAQQKLPIMLPPFNFQNEFASLVRQIHKSKFRMQEGLKKLELQYNALMQQSFS